MLREAFRTLGIAPEDEARILAIGWATVELDRAIREFAASEECTDGFVDAPPSVLLGASCRISQGSDGPRLVLLEPSTEGRLAATLARHGEGWVAVWLLGPQGDIDGGQGSDGPTLSADRPGPLGTERLVLSSPPAGPHRLLVRPATIGMP